MSPVSSTSHAADKNKQQEIWKPVKDYEESYEISSCGRVRSLHFAKPRLIKLHPADGGQIVFLSQKGKKQTFYVSELLEKTFPEGVNQASATPDKNSQTSSSAASAQGTSAAREDQGSGKGKEPFDDLQSGEQWKDIPGYVGSYQVSELGNVRSLSMTPSFILRQTVSAEGRPQVSLYSFRNKSGRRLGKSTVTNFDVEELVARAFVAQTPREGEVVLHKNGDLKDNRADNLCWGRAEDARKLAEETAAAAKVAQARQALKDKAQRLAEAARAAAQSKQEAESAKKVQEAQEAEEARALREKVVAQAPAAPEPVRGAETAEEESGKTSFARVQEEADRILAQLLKKPQDATPPAPAPKAEPAQEAAQADPAAADTLAKQADTEQAADGSLMQMLKNTGQDEPAAESGKPEQAQEPASQDKPAQSPAAPASAQDAAVSAGASPASSKGAASAPASPATVEAMRRRVKPRMQSLSDRSVCCSTLKGGMLCMFPSASAAARALGCVDTLDVMVACEGLIAQLCGYQWQWVKAAEYKRWSALAAPITMLPSLDWLTEESR